MAPVLKTGVPERVSGVRIPPLPPPSSSKISKDIQTNLNNLGKCWGYVTQPRFLVRLKFIPALIDQVSEHA